MMRERDGWMDTYTSSTLRNIYSLHIQTQNQHNNQSIWGISLTINSTINLTIIYTLHMQYNTHRTSGVEEGSVLTNTKWPTKTTPALSVSALLLYCRLDFLYWWPSVLFSLLYFYSVLSAFLPSSIPLSLLFLFLSLHHLSHHSPSLSSLLCFPLYKASRPWTTCSSAQKSSHSYTQAW